MSSNVEPSLLLRDAVLMACCATAVRVIEQGRLQILMMPKDWVGCHILDAATESLDPNDDWSFRRLLELLAMVCPGLIAAVVKDGLASLNPEIREAAVDFSSPETIERVGRTFTQSLAERNPELRMHLQI